MNNSFEKSDLASNVLAVDHRWRLDVSENLPQNTLLDAIHVRPMTLGLVAFARLYGSVLKVFNMVAVIVKVVHVVVFICQLIVVRVSKADFALAEVIHSLLGAAAKKLRRLRLLHHFRLPEIDVHLVSQVCDTGNPECRFFRRKCDFRNGVDVHHLLVDVLRLQMRLEGGLHFEDCAAVGTLLVNNLHVLSKLSLAFSCAGVLVPNLNEKKESELVKLEMLGNFGGTHLHDSFLQIDFFGYLLKLLTARIRFFLVALVQIVQLFRKNRRP